MLPRAKKTFSQNWLVDETVVKKIIAAADIAPGDHILEIGPGTGVLTQALVDAGARVTAIEADSTLIPALRERLGSRVHIIQGDSLSYSPTLLPSYAVIANIPYHITSDLLRHFLTAPHPPTRMVLMLQREVADRIIAKPPHMSLLSVVCQLYARCEKIANVPAGAFRPIPKVDSAIVRLETIDGDREQEAIIRLAKAGFSSPRKQLHSNLAHGLHIGSNAIKLALENLHIDPKARAESLTVDNWVHLRTRLQS